MDGVRNSNDAGSPEAADTHQRSPAGPPPSVEGTDVPDLVERHRQSASRLLKEGQAARAFGELVRASHALPMTPRLAAALVTFSLRAGTEAAAIALLSSALGNTQGESRRAVRFQLVRVLRRVRQLPRAVEALQALADEVPGDRRARRLLDTLFRRIGHEPALPEPSRAQAAQASQAPVPPPRPPHARFTPRAPQLELSNPWARDEGTLPFGLAQPPAAAPRDDSAGEAFSHRRETLDVPEDWEEQAAAEAPVSRTGAPLTPPPARARADVPVPWSSDEDTEPSRRLVPRRKNP